MELLKRREAWNINYNHALGETASWFYVQIRDHAKIYGRRCGATVSRPSGITAPVMILTASPALARPCQP